MPRTIAAAALLATTLSLVQAANAAKPGSVLASFSGAGTFTWTVPNGVKRATFFLHGAAGWGPRTSSAPGGLGGETSATFDVKAGQVYEIVGGGQGGPCGSGGFNGGASGSGIGAFAGGGGGGATDVRTGTCAASMSCDLGTRIAVAGGGGGSGSNAGCHGGDGGGSTGAAGIANDGEVAGGGGGGSQTGGGSAGAADAVPGSFGFGGTAGLLGGGGGGGWFGGGGGGSVVLDIGGGGAGGSGYVSPLAVSGAMQTGVSSGGGAVTISKAS